MIIFACSSRNLQGGARNALLSVSWKKKPMRGNITLVAVSASSLQKRKRGRSQNAPPRAPQPLKPAANDLMARFVPEAHKLRIHL